MCIPDLDFVQCLILARVVTVKFPFTQYTNLYVCIIKLQST